jgi:shikimate kinase
MPGSGKSTAAEWLAGKIGWTYVDTDIIIQFNTGKSIAEIFEEEGEEAYRIHEKCALLQTFDMQDVVVATGGGTPCWFNNMEQMNAAGLTIWLQCNPEELGRRMRQDNAVRPLFAGLDEHELALKLYEMQEQRVLFYAQSRLVMASGWSLVDLYSVVNQLLS